MSPSCGSVEYFICSSLSASLSSLKTPQENLSPSLTSKEGKRGGGGGGGGGGVVRKDQDECERERKNFFFLVCRRLFNWFAYLLFLYNGFAGFVSAILRMIITAVISLLLLFRLDTTILPRGFEVFDSGTNKVTYSVTHC